jgi:hypothetical protein
MKKLLLIALAVSGLALVPGERADARVTVGLPGVGGISFGFPGGYYGYPTSYILPLWVLPAAILLLFPAIFILLRAPLILWV